MRLKRLEIQGFKSFARPVCLDFGPGITAIVGPNGSGKSNISDALRWVMGEQSAKSLRGYKMEDVIFAGSEGKKPLGMAEVQLTLNNSEGFLPLDYAEVSVTRRVYRSGDSEFFINKQSCRLRDIHDLFTDTGLGREGYSIIGQGQIDAVLSVRSEDRRVLLEETAGIVKYRQRKEQALRKLEDTSVDLLRVTDILHELENQLEPLGEQAKKARLYLDLATRLHTTELDFFHLSWKSLDEKWAQSEKDLLDLQSEYEHYSKQLAELEAAKAGLEAERVELEETIERHQQEFMALTEALNQGLNSIELHNERLRNQDARSEQLAGFIRAKEEELKLLQDEDGGLEQEVQELLDRIRGKEAEISKALKGMEGLQLNHRQTQSTINSLKDDFFDFMRLLADKRNLQRGFADREQNLKAQIAANEQEINTLANKKAANEEHRLSLKVRKDQLLEELANCGTREAAVSRRLEETKELLAKQRQEVRLQEGQRAQVQSRLKTLQELEEGYEGYAAGVRRIMQSRDMSKLVLGTVADVIRVPEGLETAFEVALGSSLQNLITEGEEEAKSLIAWLKKVQGGRVTILPLDSMKGAEFTKDSARFWSRPGVLGTALELLGFSDKYRPALASLLGRVVITEDLDTALALKRDLRQFSRIVTRDGSVVFPSGAMTGGSLNNRTSGLLARKGELARLEAEADALQSLLDSGARREEELLGLIDTLEKELAVLQEEGVEARMEVQRVHQAQEQAQKELEMLQDTQKELEEKKQNLEAILANLASEAELATTEIASLEEEEKARREQIQAYEQSLAELAAAIEERSQDQTRRQVQLAELKGVLENQRILLANLEQKRDLARRSMEEAKLEVAALAEARRNNEAVIVETQAVNEKNRILKADLQVTIESEKQKRQDLQKEQERLGAELLQMEKEQLKRERSLYKCEVEKEQLQAEREQILSVLKEREVPLESILAREVHVKEGTLKRNMAELRNQIRDLGPVNPGANEEYERVLERCSFLKTQLEDLNEARVSLQDVIEEMDKLCRTKLWDVFKKVQVEFQAIFSRLFLGGKAELILTDPESILTTGIDVMARPPGKKLQNLLALSGGERALTAIALLFAIRRVQPTPFWLLDEIDAALDESNLGRFVELMEDFSKDTQFLVVTHRPRTMEAAHTLYGVTMGDDGFSQIISVALT